MRFGFSPKEMFDVTLCGQMEDDDEEQAPVSVYTTSTSGWPVMKTVVDRYYTQLFDVQIDDKSEDHYIHMHSNGYAARQSGREGSG